MATGNFEQALALVLVHEGGLSDDKYDPGGRTYQGILQPEYDAYRRNKNLPSRDVAKMEPAERDEIYRAGYWDPTQADQLPPGLDYVVFDGAVNSGVSRSIQWLQRALGTVAIDGHLGPITIAAISQHPDLHALILSACEARREFLRHLSILPHFPGLLIRVDDVQKTALAWAAGEAPKPATPSAPSAKALQKTARSAPSTAPGDLLAAASTGALAVGVAANTQLVAVVPAAKPAQISAPPPAETKPPVASPAAPAPVVPPTASKPASVAGPSPSASQAPPPAKTAATPPPAKAAKAVTATPPSQPFLAISQNQSYLIFGGLSLLLILGLFLAWHSRKARARQADALGENPFARTPLKLPTSTKEVVQDVNGALPLVQNLYVRAAAIAWIALTIVINVIAFAKLLQGFKLANENWHDPFFSLGRLYDNYAGQAFTVMAASVSQNYGVGLPHWLMPAFVLYISMASAFVVASSGLMRRETSAQSLWGAVIHAGWILAIPSFVMDAVRYRVVTTFARQNTVLFFAYVALFVGFYVIVRFVNDDILPGFVQQHADLVAMVPFDKLK